MHAHVGFLAQGQIHIEFADGCVLEFRAPQVVAIEPGHDGWVVGDEPAVLIEVDFGKETCITWECLKSIRIAPEGQSVSFSM